MVTLIEYIKKSTQNKTDEIRENTVRSLNKITVEFASAQQLGRSLSIVVILSIGAVVFYLVFLDLSKLELTWFNDFVSLIKLIFNRNKIRPSNNNNVKNEKIFVTKAKNDLTIDNEIFQIQQKFYENF